MAAFHLIIYGRFWVITEAKRTAYPLYLWQWHRFIDHIAKDKTAESFFETLQ